MEIIILSLAALIAGFVDAISGGGGVITFPALMLIGLSTPQILGTNKLISTAGTTIAAYTFARHGLVQTQLVTAALPFTFVGSLLGSATVLLISNDFLKPLVSLLIIAVALYCYFKPDLGTTDVCDEPPKHAYFSVPIMALIIGFYDGFFGPGTGIFLNLSFIWLVNSSFLHATANTKVLNWTSNAISLCYFIVQGNIRFDFGIAMMLANIVGGYLGAHTAISQGSKFIRIIYLLMAALTSFKLIADWTLQQ